MTSTRPAYLKSLPSVERLKACLHYDPDTGLFTRLWPTNHKGRVTGWGHYNGYLMITIDKEDYFSHRLAYLYMTASEPPVFVDHIDRDKRNNRWDNLRPADRASNAANSKLPKNSTSGLKGAQKSRYHHRWRSSIRENGRTIYLGMFDTAEEAHAAYRRAAERIHGNYARMS
jgi:hypothetical protein